MYSHRIHPAPPLTVSVNVILNPLTVFEKTPKSSVPALLQHVLTADKAVCDQGLSDPEACIVIPCFPDFCMLDDVVEDLIHTEYSLTKDLVTTWLLRVKLYRLKG